MPITSIRIGKKNNNHKKAKTGMAFRILKYLWYLVNSAMLGWRSWKLWFLRLSQRYNFGDKKVLFNILSIFFLNIKPMHSFVLTSWVQKIPWRREWLPTPVFLPGEFHGQRSLVGYSPWDCKESDMTEGLTLSLFSSNMYGIKS